MKTEMSRKHIIMIVTIIYILYNVTKTHELLLTVFTNSKTSDLQF